MMPNKKWQKNILHQLVQDKYSQLLIERGVILFLNHDLFTILNVNTLRQLSI